LEKKKKKTDKIKLYRPFNLINSPFKPFSPLSLTLLEIFKEKMSKSAIHPKR
jgi:hypothetical protein